MKRKNFFYGGVMALMMAFSMSACSESDDPKPDTGGTDDPTNLDYTAENADAWGNYMYNVGMLLNQDASDLYKYWTEDYDGKGPYATIFKDQTSGAYSSALACIQEMVEGGMWNIANEVGDAKIKDPWEKYTSGDKEGGLYAVESWYSWHSRDDYTNNIYSIRNAYYGSLDGKVSDKSISKLVAGVNAELDMKVSAAITTAASAIQAIPQPFRNNINSQETVAAIKACEELESVLDKELKPYIRDNSTINSNEALDPIVENYVNVVVLPTYKDLKEKNSTLYDAVVALANNPSNSAFETACNAWITAREPWEESEALLFAPVDELGLDPNMDSWPLDQNAIVQILNSQKWGDLEWSEGDDDAKVESAQNVRGFHTLEFLLFKDGKPRTVK